MFVGREPELELLRQAFGEAVAGPGCRLVTVVGEPGIGKTRLLGEFVSCLAGEGRVLTGHCLPYGEGITYWPLAEIVRGLAPDDAEAALAGYLASDERGELICALILGAVGLSDRVVSVEETQWAVRRLLEALARERPLVVVIEDLHWAEPTFLQLVEYLAGFSTGHPILLLAAARDELLETRPGWALPSENTQLAASAGAVRGGHGDTGRPTHVQSPFLQGDARPRCPDRGGQPALPRTVARPPGRSRATPPASCRCRRRSRRCSPPVSTGSRPSSGICSNAPPSRALPSTAARSPPCCRRASRQRWAPAW